MHVLLVSGLIGAIVGALLYPTWHVAVETAQVVAGLVTYPPDNPFYTYHTKLWTILHQAGAGLLLLGFSERTLSIGLSGLLGMLSFQAISMTVYVLSRHTLIAIAAPFVVLVGRVAEHGPLYPVTLVGTVHTYGAVGLSAGVLAMALVGSGCYRTGAFLFGLLPAVHASIGVWLFIVACLAALVEFRRPESPVHDAVKYAIGGAAIAALSLILQLTMITDLPDVDADTAARYFYGFVAFWDGHRYPLDLTMAGVSLNRSALVLAIAWLITRRDMTREARLWIRMIVASGVVSLACLVLSWIPPGSLPVAILQLMPSRVMNVNVFVLAPMVIGILFALEGSVAVHLTRLAVLAAFALNADGIFWDWRPGLDRPWWIQRVGSWVIDEFAVIAALSLLAVAFLQRTKGPTPVTVRPPWHRWIANASALGATAIVAVSAYGTWSYRFLDTLDDRTNHGFWAEVAADPANGMTAVAGTSQLIQLYTRRPVIVNTGALDTLSYAPESGPALDRLLRDIYDLDLFNPPETIRAGSGSLSVEFNKQVWERFSLERWQAIRREHNVTQVMTYAPYVLDLPVAAETNAHKLYRIPD